MRDHSKYSGTKVLPGIVAGFVGIVATSVFAQEQSATTTERNPNFMESRTFLGSKAMPDHIAYNILASMLVRNADISKKDQVAYAMSGTDLGEAEASQLVEKLRPSLTALWHEKDTAVREALCKADIGSWSGTKAITMWDNLVVHHSFCNFPVA